MQEVSISFKGVVGSKPRTGSGEYGAWASVSVAVSHYKKNKENTTSWFSVFMPKWEAENIASRIEKGDRVHITGFLELGEYNGKVQANVNATSFTWSQSNRKSNGPGPGNYKGHKNTARTQAPQEYPTQEQNDDLPF